jgi:hypothetical protein
MKATPARTRGPGILLAFIHMDINSTRFVHLS